MLLYDCKIGERYEYSAGANRGRAVLDLTLPDVAVCGTRKISVAEDLIAIWHHGNGAGTWHGFRAPVAFAADPHPSSCPEITPVGAFSSSSSGGGQAFAAVVKIPPEGIVFLTSGYDGRRGWKVHTVTLAGVVSTSLQEYQAAHAATEVL